MLLSHYSYLPVYAKRCPVRVLLRDEEEDHLFSENAELLSKIEALQAKNAATRYQLFFHLAKDLRIEGRKLEGLETLFLESCLPKSEYFTTEEAFNSFQGDKFVLPTDLLVGAKLDTNLAAGRNILLRNLEIKGCGRNSGAVRLDYAHAWGGLYLIEAIHEYLSSQILHFSTRLGSEKVLSIAIKLPIDEISFSSQALILRQRSSPRVSQSLRFSDQNAFSLVEIENKVSEIAHHYFSSMLMGFLHTSLIPENAVINGKMFDTTAVKSSPHHNGLLGTILLSSDDPLLAQIGDPESLRSVRNLCIENNSVLNYGEVIYQTMMAYKMQSEDFDLNRKRERELTQKIIAQTIEKISPDASDKVWRLCSCLMELPQKKLLAKDQFGTLIDVLCSVEVLKFHWNHLERDGRPMIKIDFGIDLQLEVPDLVKAFNSSQGLRTMQDVLTSFSKLIPQLDLENHHLDSHLNYLVLEFIKLDPLAPKRPISFLAADLGDGDVLYNIFTDDKKMLLPKDEIMKLKKPLVVFGKQSQLEGRTKFSPQKPLYYAD